MPDQSQTGPPVPDGPLSPSAAEPRLEGGLGGHPGSPGSSAGRRWIGRLVQLALLAVLGFFVVRALAEGLAQIDWRSTRLPAGWVVLSFLCVLVNRALVATAYRATFASVHPPPPWPVILGATWLSRAGKYIPGKVFSVAGMAWLLRRHGVSATLAAGTVIINTTLAVVVGMIVSAPLLIWDPAVRQRVPLAWLWTLILLAAGLGVLHPRVYFPLLNWALRRLNRSELPICPRWRDHAAPAAQMLLQWVLAGAGLWCLARGLRPDLPAAWLPAAVSISALAMTLGFVALLAPAGLGVREAVYLAALAPAMGLGAAALVTIATRVLHTAAEGLLAVVGLALLRSARPPQPGGP